MFIIYTCFSINNLIKMLWKHDIENNEFTPPYIFYKNIIKIDDLENWIKNKTKNKGQSDFVFNIQCTVN